MDTKKFKIITDNYFDGKISEAKNSIKELNQKELMSLIEYFSGWFPDINTPPGTVNNNYPDALGAINEILAWSRCEKITYTYLQDNGERLESACEGTCFLYSLNGENYVVLQDNSIITQKEDNELSDPIFPFINKGGV